MASVGKLVSSTLINSLAVRRVSPLAVHILADFYIIRHLNKFFMLIVTSIPLRRSVDSQTYS